MMWRRLCMLSAQPLLAGLQLRWGFLVAACQQGLAWPQAARSPCSQASLKPLQRQASCYPSQKKRLLPSVKVQAQVEPFRVSHAQAWLSLLLRLLLRARLLLGSMRNAALGSATVRLIVAVHGSGLDMCSAVSVHLPGARPRPALVRHAFHALPTAWTCSSA